MYGEVYVYGGHALNLLCVRTVFGSTARAMRMEQSEAVSAGSVANRQTTAATAGPGAIDGNKLFSVDGERLGHAVI